MMQAFKSKAPELVGFQWVDGISVKDKLVELIGNEDFQLTSDEDMGLVFLEYKEYFMDIFHGDWVLKYPDGSILAMEPEELYDTYVKVC